MNQIPYLLDGDTTILLAGKVLIAKRTKHQLVSIVETNQFGKALMIEGVVQLSEKDEAIYHEALIHPAMAMHASPKKILIIGGGDGGSLREVLKHNVDSAVIVDIDEELITLTRQYIPIAEEAFKDKRAKVIIGDGKEYVERCKEKYDVIILDLSDPEGPATALFTKEFYQKIKKILNDDGVIAVQTDSPIIIPKVMGRVNAALEEVFKNTHTYAAFIPGFYTPNGMIIATDNKINLSISDEIKKRNIKLKAFTPSELEETIRSRLFLKDVLSAKWTPSTDNDPVSIKEEIKLKERIKELNDTIKKHPQLKEHV